MKALYVLFLYESIGFFCMLAIFRAASVATGRPRLVTRDYAVAFMFSWAGVPIMLAVLCGLAWSKYKKRNMIKEIEDRL